MVYWCDTLVDFPCANGFSWANAMVKKPKKIRASFEIDESNNMRWSNIPIPEVHLIGLVIGTVIQFLFSNRLFQLPWIGFAIGLPLIIIGIGLCAWSVVEAKEMNIASPNMLLKTGPYALSRNPMYVGWTLTLPWDFIHSKFSLDNCVSSFCSYLHSLCGYSERRAIAEG